MVPGGDVTVHTVAWLARALALFIDRIIPLQIALFIPATTRSTGNEAIVGNTNVEEAINYGEEEIKLNQFTPNSVASFLLLIFEIV